MRNPSASSSGTACCSKVGLKRGPWTPEEDEVLASYIKREGEGRWRTLPKRAGLLRCGKSCRLRWMNYLRPDVKRGHIASDEEDLILRLHRLLGNRWSLIAGRIPGRTDNEIKNYWNTHLSKKLISQGIDPRTHKPLKPINPNTLSKQVQEKTPPPPLPPGPAPAAPAPAPNPNPSPSPSTNPSPGPSSNPSFDPNCHHPYTAVGEAEGFSGGVMRQHNQNSYFNETNIDVSDQWRVSEGFATMDSQRIRSNEEISNEEGIVDCSASDDIFSSFLNSLINEDMILQQQQQDQQVYNQDYHGNNNNNCNQVAQLDPPISFTAGLNLGEWWEASFSSSTASDQDVHGKSVDHVGKHL